MYSLKKLHKCAYAVYELRDYLCSLESLLTESKQPLKAEESYIAANKIRELIEETKNACELDIPNYKKIVEAVKIFEKVGNLPSLRDVEKKIKLAMMSNTIE